MEAIAERADVALTSLYGNFGAGKTEVYAVLACQMARSHAQRMTAELERSPGSGVTAGRIALQEYVAFHADEPTAFRLLGLTDVAAETVPVVHQARQEVASILRSVIDQVVTAIGGDDHEVRSVVLLAWSGINGLLALNNRGMIDDATAHALLERAIGLYLREFEDLR